MSDRNLRGSEICRPDRSFARRFAVGAETDGTGTCFRVWAPEHSDLVIVFDDGRNQGLAPEPDGYFSGYIAGAVAGDRYRIRLDGQTATFPDPASRFQPDGPHGSSQIIDPSRFQWDDRDWRGISLPGQVIYEMHTGTFTEQG